MNISEFNKQKGKKAEHTHPQSDGYLKVKNNYESFEMGPSNINSAKTPYFLKASKIREVIFASEGVCSIRTYKGWRNSLYQAGYANVIAQKANNAFWL